MKARIDTAITYWPAADCDIVLSFPDAKLELRHRRGGSLYAIVDPESESQIGLGALKGTRAQAIAWAARQGLVADPGLGAMRADAAAEDAASTLDPAFDI